MALVLDIITLGKSYHKSAFQSSHRPFNLAYDRISPANSFMPLREIISHMTFIFLRLGSIVDETSP